MAEVMFYKRPVILDRTAHAKLRFTPLNSFAFAAKATFVPVMAAEFAMVCLRYPIAFLEDPQGNVQSYAVLSLVEGSNAFVNDQGQWTSTYVPAFVRRYPFVPANLPKKNDGFAIAVDMDSGCFDPEKGDPLFDEKNEPGTLLKNQVDFLQRFHAENLRTIELTKQLKTEGLLTPLNVDITRAADQEKFRVRGFMMVDEKKLTALPADKAGAFLSSGLLALTYTHLISLRNFEHLAMRTGHINDNAVPWWAK